MNIAYVINQDLRLAPSRAAAAMRHQCANQQGAGTLTYVPYTTAQSIRSIALPEAWLWGDEIVASMVVTLRMMVKAAVATKDGIERAG